MCRKEPAGYCLQDRVSNKTGKKSKVIMGKQMLFDFGILTFEFERWVENYY
jgi:hypothetical protein